MSSSSSTLTPSVATAEEILAAMADQAFNHLSKGEWTETRDVLLRALALAPQMAPLHAALASAHYHSGDRVSAAAAFTRASELDPFDIDLLKQGAHVYIEMRQRADAERLLRQAVMLDPKDAQLQEMLRQCDEVMVTPVVEAPPRNRTSLVALDPGLTLEMGDHSYVHGDKVRNPSGARTHLKIGRFCSIATDLTVIGYDHRSNWITTFPFLDPFYRPQWPGTANATLPGAPEVGGNFDRGNITVGNDVWIGCEVKLFKGVTIGDGAVVGACSLVNKDVPPYTIVAGIPAHPIRKRFTDDEIAILHRIAWWDWPEWKINHHMPYLCSSRLAELEAKLAGEFEGEIPAGPLPDSAAPETPDAIDQRPIVEVLRQRPASAHGAVSNYDAKFIWSMIAEFRPDVVFEIGVASGVSSAVILKSLDVHAPHASLISYDIAAQCYFDKALPVGYSVPLMVPGHRARFQLFTGADKLAQARNAVSAFKRKLIFIDADHRTPAPALDLLHNLDLANAGDLFLLHDINLPVIAPKFASERGAMELYQLLPQPKWHSPDPNRNIGAYRFDGNYQELWRALSHYLRAFKLSPENQAALARLEAKARLAESVQPELSVRS